MLFGQKQTLIMVKKVDFGVYLAETAADTENKVLLPAKQVPAGLRPSASSPTMST